nr:reverse transcriptase domain-containing protein [Tanacetum cinerariifolium]GEX43521.1 reverse transcriptase domain-containing protein [Tanacetum cinerariifolium]
MLNNVRLEVKEESEVSLELLRFCMSTRSSVRRLLSPIEDPKKLLSRKSRSESSLLFDLKEDDMARQALPPGSIPDLRSMEELLQAPIDGVGDAIVVPLILTNQFELKIANGNFLNKNTQEALTIIENKSKVQASRNKTQVASASGSSTQDAYVTALTKKFKALLSSFNQPVNSVQDSYETCGGPHPYYECQATGGYTRDVYATSGTYNQGGNAYQPQDGPSVPPPPFSSFKEVESDPKMIMDQEKLLGLEKYSLTKNCLVVLLKKLLRILRDPGRFLIPYDFHGLESYIALADLGASINLMPLFVWKKLSLPNLMPTRITLELATRSITYPAGIADDVCVQVGKFIFLADFIVVDYDVDPCVPLILRTTRALVDVHGEELILRDGDEKLIFHADSTSKHPHKQGNESINMIKFIDITCEDRFLKVLKIKKLNHPSSGSTTPLSDSLPSLTPFETSDPFLEEFAEELALLDLFPTGNEDDNFDPEANLRKIKYLLNQDPSTESDIEIIDPILERFTYEPALIYSPLLGDDDDDDDLFDLKSDKDEWKKLLYGDFYKDIDSKKDKNKDSKIKLLINKANFIESNDLLPQLLDSNSTHTEESSA